MKREHHRNFPGRPPRREFRKAPRQLYARFLRNYLLPHWLRILLAFVMIGTNACSVYLMAYYGKIVVDRILAIETVGKTEDPHADARIWARVAGQERRNPSRQGLARRLDAASLPKRPPEAERLLLLMFLLYVSSVVALNVVERFAQHQSILVSRNVAARLREDLHEKILELSLRYHQSTTPGRLLSRITSDVDTMQNQTMQTITLTSRVFFMLVIGFFILFSLDWRIGLIFFCIAPAYALIHRHFRGDIRHFNQELRHTNSCLYGLVTQKLEAIKAIQAYAREGLERLNMHRLAACFLRDAVAQQRQTAGLQGMAGALSGLASAGIFLFTTHLVMKGELSIGELLLVHGTIGALFIPVAELTNLGIITSNMQVTLGRMLDVMEAEPDRKDAPDAVPMPAPLKRGITIRNLAFAYGDSDEENDAVLRAVDLDIPAGSWLCIMGASGCGKSTLLHLLARLYAPGRGHIHYDGIPLSKLTMESLRRSIGFVPQTPQIFSGTIRDNITYGKPDASPNAIMRAARMAEMHEFILKQLPVQYETLVGERGTSLSGGQRQRLALARALLTNPELLLLDDCTSALDAATERKIQDTLAASLAGKTAVIVSQRVSMARRCHRIAVLENGVVSEYGTHDELLRLGGFYARLHTRQTENR